MIFAFAVEVTITREVVAVYISIMSPWIKVSPVVSLGLGTNFSNSFLLENN
ncbi:hypothetical protein J6590_090425 [Homalodisca vitripennis]|nr:hypothetical protein J6590_090425 [Homalodisca vitripennis]